MWYALEFARFNLGIAAASRSNGKLATQSPGFWCKQLLSGWRPLHLNILVKSVDSSCLVPRQPTPLCARGKMGCQKILATSESQRRLLRTLAELPKEIFKENNKRIQRNTKRNRLFGSLCASNSPGHTVRSHGWTDFKGAVLMGTSPAILCTDPECP